MDRRSILGTERSKTGAGSPRRLRLRGGIPGSKDPARGDLNPSREAIGLGIRTISGVGPPRPTGDRPSAFPGWGRVVPPTEGPGTPAVPPRWRRRSGGAPGRRSRGRSRHGPHPAEGPWGSRYRRATGPRPPCGGPKRTPSRRVPREQVGRDREVDPDVSLPPRTAPKCHTRAGRESSVRGHGRG